MKNLLIGLFVVVALGLIVGIILFLKPSIGDGKETLVVRFSNINGLSVGTRVMFAGKPIGEVFEIQQISQAREQPTDELGQLYFYQLILKIDSSVHIYNTDEIMVQTSGLLGEKSIAIIPRSPPKGVFPSLVTSKMPIYATSIDPLKNMLDEWGHMSHKIGEVADRAITWIDQHTNELGAAIRSFDDFMAEATATLSTINQNHLIDDIQDGVQHFSHTMNALAQSIDQISQEKVITNLGHTLSNMSKASSALSHIMQNVVNGHGTFGQLIMKDDTYLRVTAILSKVNTLMNDFNHYGLFFSLNKEWQRTRLKQVTLLNALSTPQGFYRYFSQHVDLINTQMSQLAMLISHVENNKAGKKIFNTRLFQQNFSELMRNAQALYDNLKLYNEQLIDAQRAVEQNNN